MIFTYDKKSKNIIVYGKIFSKGKILKNGLKAKKHNITKTTT